MPLLLQLLRLSLAEWPALQLAIEQGMGGTDARDKETWMAQVIFDFLQQNKHVVDEDELYDYIADMMDNEFDTIVDDGSMTMLIRRISVYCKLHLDGKEAELQAILSRKSEQVKTINASAKPPVASPIASPSAGVESSTRDDMSLDPATEEPPTDEWTLVTRKSKRT